METFLLRLWVPHDGAEPPQILRGFVEHPRTEQRWNFAGAEALFARLTEALAAHGSVPADAHKNYGSIAVAKEDERGT
jgi:hypothetical protein